MKKSLLFILSFTLATALPLAAVNIGPSTTTVDLPTESATSPETFNLAGDINTSTTSGNAVEGNISTSDWIINNTGFNVIGNAAAAGFQLNASSFIINNNAATSTIQGGTNAISAAINGSSKTSSINNSSGALIKGANPLLLTDSGSGNTYEINNTGSGSIIEATGTDAIRFLASSLASSSTLSILNDDSAVIKNPVNDSIFMTAASPGTNLNFTNSNAAQVTSSVRALTLEALESNVTINAQNTSGAQIQGTTGISLFDLALKSGLDATINNSNGATISGLNSSVSVTANGNNASCSITNTDSSLLATGDNSSSIIAQNTSTASNTTVNITNTGPSALIKVKDAAPYGSDAIDVIASGNGFTSTINNLDQARAEAQYNAVFLFSGSASTGLKTFTVNNSGGSTLKSFGNRSTSDNSAILTQFLSSNSHCTINNSGTNSLIEGKSAGIQIFSGTVADTSHTINNSAIIKGSAGPAILAEAGARGSLTVNLDTGSDLQFTAQTAIQGTDEPTGTPNTINLAGDGTQSGDFTNINTLNKNGTGTWTLNPMNGHFIDNINVNAGTLVLNTLSTNPTLSNASTTLNHTTTVKSGASLQGFNYFGSAGNPATLTIESGGTHKPGNSLGATLITEGTYNLNGTLEIEYAADIPFDITYPGQGIQNLFLTSYGQNAFSPDLVAIGGTTNISGAKIDAQALSGTLAENMVFPFLFTTSLNADGSPVTLPIVGNPQQTCDPDMTGNCFGITQILNNSANGKKLILQGFDLGTTKIISLLVINNSLLELLQTPGNPTPSANAIALATNLDSFNPAFGSPLCAIKASLQNSDPTLLNELLNRLSSSPLADTSFVSFENSLDFLSLLRTHLTNLRNHNPPPRKNSLWDQAFLSIQDRDNATQFAGLDSRTYSYAAGFDRFFWNPRFQMGATIGYTNTHLDWKRNLGSSEINSLFFGPYASWKCLDDNHEGYYMDAAFLAGWHDYKNKRSVPLSNLVASSNPNGWSMDARLGAGFNVLLSDILMTPFGYADYLWTRQDAFTETGAGNAGFTLGKQTHDMMRYELGASLSENFKLGCGWVLAPKLTMSWVNKTPIGNQNLNTSFIGQNGFTIQSYDKTRNQVAAAAELTAIIREHLFVSLFYNAEIGDNQHTHTSGLKGSWRF